MMDDLVQRLRYMADDEAPIDMTASETARQAADELDRWEGRALSAEAEIERLRAQLAECDLELRKANIKLRDRAHPASEPRDPPEVLASAGFWPDCGCGECYAIHCLGNALAQLAERGMDVERLRSALVELVACKDLKDELTRLRSDPYYVTQADIREAAYERRKPAAWDAARAAIDAAMAVTVTKP